MNNKVKETLGILQEECAEVIVEASKCLRFGLGAFHYRAGISHQDMLETEIGDMLAMVDILIQQGILDQRALDIAKENKRKKLETWSGIFKD